MSLKSRLTKQVNDAAAENGLTVGTTPDPGLSGATPTAVIVDDVSSPAEREPFAFVGSAAGYEGSTPTETMVGAIKVTSR